jgi:hypothetical protein
MTFSDEDTTPKWRLSRGIFLDAVFMGLRGYWVVDQVDELYVDNYVENVDNVGN